MDVSILLARIMGPTFLVVGLGVLLNAAYYVDMVKSFVENKEHYYFSGVAALIIGISIVLFHNIWVADWRTAFTPSARKDHAPRGLCGPAAPRKLSLFCPAPAAGSTAAWPSAAPGYRRVGI